jgi:hypothetical protein
MLYWIGSIHSFSKEFPDKKTSSIALDVSSYGQCSGKEIVIPFMDEF